LTHPMILQAKAKLNEILTAPVVELGTASTLAAFILSAEEAMHEKVDQREKLLREVGQDIYDVQNSIDVLLARTSDPNAMEILIRDFVEIIEAQDRLADAMERIKRRIDAQHAKVAQYDVEFLAEAAE
jgi:uncharacterized protein Yka (UPF0111/DUF47 family)